MMKVIYKYNRNKTTHRMLAEKGRKTQGRETHRITHNDFENMVQKKIFGPMRNKVIWE